MHQHDTWKVERYLALSMSLENVMVDAKQPHNVELGVKVRRTSSTVSLVIQCASEYDAIETYDRILESSRTGQIIFALEGVTANAG